MTGAKVQLAWRAPNNKDWGVELKVRPKSEWQGKESSQSFTITETVRPCLRVTIAGNSSLAVIYGVYQYLSDQGVRWFEPGAVGTNIPKLTELKINERTYHGTPSFSYRCLDFTGWHDFIFDNSDERKYREETHYEYDLWLLRNRLIFDRSIHHQHYFDFNRAQSPLGHNLKKMCKLAPRDINKEPERFPLVTRNFKQERTAYQAQVCFTHETNIRNAVDSAIEHFKSLDGKFNEVDDAVSMSLSDCTGICECPKCAEVAGSEPYAKDRLVWYFMNRIAKELDRRMPGKKIMLFAPYFELTRPPVDVRIEPNIIAVACRSVSWLNTPENIVAAPFTREHRTNIEATQHAGAQMQCYDYFLWKNTPQPLDILDAARYYAANGYKRYHAEVMHRSELSWSLLWTLAAFTWNSTRDPQQLLNEFCTQYYGPTTGQLVLEIHKALHENSRRMHRVIYGGPADTSQMLDDKTIKEYLPRLVSAEQSAGGIEQQRIRNLRVSLETQMRYAEFYRVYSHALNERSHVSRNKVKSAAESFIRFWYENKVAELNDPFPLRSVMKLSQVNFAKIVPKGRAISSELKIRELFAGTEPPQNIEVFYLSEIWKFQLDIDDEGLKKGWEKPDFNDSKWPSLSTWEMFEPQGYTDVDGRFWYRSAFDAPQYGKNEKIMLRIGSLDDDGEIYVNGKLVYTQLACDMWDKSFAVDVSHVLKPGQRNTIAVRGYDATGGGGLWRPSGIYVQPQSH